MKKSGTRSNQFPWERLGYKRHLRWQLIGLFVLVQAVLLLACGGVIAWLIYRMEVNSWQSRQGEVADNIAKTAATLLKDSESLVVFVGDMGSDRILKNPDIFTSMLRFNPGLDEVALLDSKGAVLTSVAKDEAVLTSVSSAVRVGWYNAAVSGQRYVGDLQRSAQNAPYLVVAVPARGGNVVVARLQAAMLEKLINDVRFGNGGRAYILNRDGVLVAHTDSQVALKRQALAGRPEVEAVKAQPSQVLHKEYTNFQGVRVVGSAELIPEQGWMVFAELPADNAYVVSKTAIFVVVAGLVVFGIAVSLGVNALLKKMVIRPVQFIQQGASEIGKGNFGYRIPVDRCDEIGQLAEAVNHMAGELQARETQLAQETEKLAAEVTERKRVERDLHLAKEGLEKRVQERTAELQLEINERKRAEQQLLYDAFHDALTGLPNRALLIDHLGRAIGHSRRRSDYNYAVLFMDLDRFKTINDSAGHSVGDQILQAFGNRLQDCIRPMDTVARIGGDEFVVLIEDIDAFQNATNLAERVLELQKIPFHLGEYDLYSTVSIGVVYSTLGYSNPEEVLRDADIALYRAKGKGKGRYEVFDPSLRDWAMKRMELESDLRRALVAEQLFLNYQPILSLQTGRLTGFEALLRWAHPKQGTIAPADFIPIAEETGLIIPIGEWVLREACRQMAAWHQAYPMMSMLTINVNISGKQFNQPDLVDQVKRVLEETGLPAQCLKLEITESVFMENIETADAILSDLQNLGVQFQIDDFGTGYSSLGYLHRFPITTIKIDRSFVNRLGINGSKSEIVRTIVALARDLGMEAVAEGVETEEQLEQLKSFGCGYGQGYLISRPVGTAAAEELLQHFLNT